MKGKNAEEILTYCGRVSGHTVKNCMTVISFDGALSDNEKQVGAHTCTDFFV